jgi:Chemoreceptor zinc-binding domain
VEQAHAEMDIAKGGRMNFDEAIKAHSSWKMKLSAYLRKPDGSLKAADVEVDNKCDLGKWIHGEGAKHSTLAEFGALKTEHAKFHKAAADVVKKADSGQSVSEDIAIGGSSPFAQASSAVVTAIMTMKKKIGG